MPTVLLIDCSLNMVERFPFVIKQNEQMETTLNIEKRSLIAKFIESLMSQNRSLTRLEPIALVNRDIAIVFFAVSISNKFLMKIV